MQMKRTSVSLAVGLAVGLGVLPSVWAVDTNFVLNVGNSVPNCGASSNCQTQNVPKFSCPSGQEPISVTVGLKNVKEQSDLNPTTNTSGALGCYTIESVTHQVLKLEIPGAPTPLSVAGAPPPNSAGYGPPPLTCPKAPPGSVSPFYWELAGGGSIPGTPLALLTTTGGPSSFTYTPANAAQFAYFTGAGTFPAQLSAQADSEETKPGTFVGGIVTNAEGTVSIEGICQAIAPEYQCTSKKFNGQSTLTYPEGAVFPQSVTATVTFANTGVVAIPAGQMTITDTLGAGLSYVAGSTAGGAPYVVGDPAGGAGPVLTWTNAAAIPASTSVTFTYDVMVLAPFVSGDPPRANQVAVQVTGGPVSSPPACSARVQVAPKTVPILGPVGLLTLLFGLPGVATLMRVRRRSR